MRLLPSAALWIALLASPALAADPIMPLEQVERGMECEGRSVVRGTDIATFDVEILDVIAQDPQGVGPVILFRASGPAVDETGMGFGFSGSPIYCPDSEGVMRNAGAVFAGVEDYGNDTALATPIESILSMPIETPPQARPATQAERNAEPWTTALTVAGAGPAVRRALWAAAAKHGVPLIHAPATASQVDTGTDLVPGSALAASMSSGAVGLNAIGTVAYRDDADRIWAFGHPFDGAGRRTLLMQGAFVHQVIGNPNPPGFNLGTYKLASAGDLAGTVDFDGNFAISGTLGALPATIPVIVNASGPTGDLPRSTSLVADESPLNHPSGIAALSLVTSIAVADRVFTALGSSGGRSYGRMCMRVEIRERPGPIRFCNRYIGDGQFLGGTEVAMGGDAAAAATLLERFDRRQIHVERLRTRFEVHEGLRFATLRRARTAFRVEPGERIRVRIAYQKPRERAETSSFTMRVPRSVRPGFRTLTLRGSPPDPGNASLEAIFSAGFGDEFGFGGPQSAPSLDGLTAAIEGLKRWDGVRATIGNPRKDGAARIRVFRHDELRIGGAVKIPLRVTPRG